MTNEERHKITVDKTKEMRTKEISRMINEGGLGADKYYKIKKRSKSSNEDKNNENN